MACVNLNNEEILDLIVSEDESFAPPRDPLCVQPVDAQYAIWYYNRREVPPISIEAYSYQAIPKCFGLISTTALDISGIMKLQNLSTFSLTGEGTLIAVIDTGVAYGNMAFRNTDGTSRIYALWDQTVQQEESEELLRDQSGEDARKKVWYGRAYTQEELNQALLLEQPYDRIPNPDTDGHGTALASIAAGGADPSNDFIGAAPNAELIVVKLRQAKNDLRAFYGIPNQAQAFAENDIMTAVAYAQEVAQSSNRPLVILMGLGTNHGSHDGTSPLCEVLDRIASMRHRVVVCGSGNEGIARHHFQGLAKQILDPVRMEINVSRSGGSFFVEVWSLAPERITVAVQSPSGEKIPRSQPYGEEDIEGTFLYEGTGLRIDYRNAGRTSRNQLVYLRFTDVVEGIWTVLVYPEHAVNGKFHAWLPMRGMLEQEVFFVNSDPDVTLTSPSDAKLSMCIGGYQPQNGAFYIDSGRGFNADGTVRPDLVAPAVEVSAKGLRDNVITFTGTSAAAAITAGGCAQILEWAVVREQAIGINSIDIQNFLIRGAVREPDGVYPNTREGYGKLNVAEAFENLR